MRNVVRVAFVVAVVLCMAGGSVLAGGSSETASAQVCGGIQGLPCDKGEFCEFEAGNCNSADLQGECVVIPEACTQQYDPVCGCDGKTYGNDCERRMAAVQKDHDGECKES